MEIMGNQGSLSANRKKEDKIIKINLLKMPIITINLCLKGLMNKENEIDSRLCKSCCCKLLLWSGIINTCSEYVYSEVAFINQFLLKSVFYHIIPM